MMETEVKSPPKETAQNTAMTIDRESEVDHPPQIEKKSKDLLILRFVFGNENCHNVLLCCTDIKIGS